MPERTMGRADWCFWWRYMRRDGTSTGSPNPWLIVPPNPLGVYRAEAANRLARAGKARRAGKVWLGRCIIEPGV